MSWPLVKLGDICTTTQGVQITKANTSNDAYEGGYRYLYIADFISNKKQSFVDDLYDHKKVTKNDLVMANTGSPGRVFKGKLGILSNNLFKISFNLSIVDRNYLYLMLSSQVFQNVLQGQMKGGIQKHLGHQTISRQVIPLPPLAEQKRIAAILDKADAIRQKRQQAINLANDFLRSVFLDMFGDPVTNPKGWSKKKLNHLLSSIDSGKSPKCEGRPATEGEWGVLKLSAVTSGEYKSTENKALLRTTDTNKKHEVRADDILFTRKNTRELVAAVAYVFDTETLKFMPDLIFRLNIRDRQLLEPLYLFALLSNNSQRKKIQSFAGGAAGSMPNISKAKLLEVEVPVPPIQLQKKLALIIEKVRVLVNHKRESAIVSDNVFNSLSQKAFAGEL